MTVGPDLRPRILLANERIVLRHSAVVVQAQRFSGKRVELLCEFAPGRIAGCDVEFSIRTKTNATAGVKLRRRQVFNDHFAIHETFRSLAVTDHTNAHSTTRVRI